MQVKISEADALINWFDEEDGFRQGTKAPRKWVLQAHSELIRLRDAILASPAQADGYPPLVCDYCGALTPDPWHSSGMLHGKMSKHIHSCDACEALEATQASPVDANVQQDAERYRWLRDNQNWQVLHRIRPGKSIEYRMREDGDWWGSWWPTYEQAIDAARASQEYK